LKSFKKNSRQYQAHRRRLQVLRQQADNRRRLQVPHQRADHRLRLRVLRLRAEHQRLLQVGFDKNKLEFNQMLGFQTVPPWLFTDAFKCLQTLLKDFLLELSVI
jgi:hypothetical protein